MEVFDTFLLFLRGRRPSFLHCYARVAVALYCWHALYADVPFAHGFVAANLAVQVFVHAYFAAVEFAATKRYGRLVLTGFWLLGVLTAFVAR